VVGKQSAVQADQRNALGAAMKATWPQDTLDNQIASILIFKAL